MVYEYIKDRCLGKKKISNNLKKRIFLFSFLLLILLMVIMLVFNTEISSEISGLETGESFAFSAEKIYHKKFSLASKKMQKVFDIQNYIKLLGKTIGVGSSDNEFKAEICGGWGKCAVDYNFNDVNITNSFNLVGVERRECLENGKIIVERRTCDPTISVKAERTDKGLGIIGPTPSIKADLPSLKIIKAGVEVFEPVPESEKEVLVSVLKISEEKGVKKLDIEILV